MTAQEQFWKWFAEDERRLFNFEANREAVFDEVAEQLQRVDRDLTFELGPKCGEKREFVISAGGIKRAFPCVTRLVKAAPQLQRWQFIAFRPRRSPVNIVEFRGKRVNPEDVQFSLLHNGELAGIYLFIPGFMENDTDLKQIGYLLLDEALGEYDVEMKVGLVEMLSPQNSTQGKRYPLSELPAAFDNLMSRLQK